MNIWCSKLTWCFPVGLKSFRRTWAESKNPFIWKRTRTRSLRDTTHYQQITFNPLPLQLNVLTFNHPSSVFRTIFTQREVLICYITGKTTTVNKTSRKTEWWTMETERDMNFPMGKYEEKEIRLQCMSDVLSSISVTSHSRKLVSLLQFSLNLQPLINWIFIDFLSVVWCNGVWVFNQDDVRRFPINQMCFTLWETVYLLILWSPGSFWLMFADFLCSKV